VKDDQKAITFKYRRDAGFFLTRLRSQLGSSNREAYSNARADSLFRISGKKRVVQSFVGNVESNKNERENDEAADCNFQVAACKRGMIALRRHHRSNKMETHLEGVALGFHAKWCLRRFRSKIASSRLRRSEDSKRLAFAGTENLRIIIRKLRRQAVDLQIERAKAFADGEIANDHHLRSLLKRFARRVAAQRGRRISAVVEGARMMRSHVLIITCFRAIRDHARTEIKVRVQFRVSALSRGVEALLLQARASKKKRRNLRLAINFSRGILCLRCFCAMQAFTHHRVRGRVLHLEADRFFLKRVLRAWLTLNLEIMSLRRSPRYIACATRCFDGWLSVVEMFRRENASLKVVDEVFKKRMLGRMFRDLKSSVIESKTDAILLNTAEEGNRKRLLTRALYDWIAGVECQREESRDSDRAARHRAFTVKLTTLRALKAAVEESKKQVVVSRLTRRKALLETFLRWREFSTSLTIQRSGVRVEANRRFLMSQYKSMSLNFSVWIAFVKDRRLQAERVQVIKARVAFGAWKKRVDLERSRMAKVVRVIFSRWRELSARQKIERLLNRRALHFWAETHKERVVRGWKWWVAVEREKLKLESETFWRSKIEQRKKEDLDRDRKRRAEREREEAEGTYYKPIIFDDFKVVESKLPDYADDEIREWRETRSDVRLGLGALNQVQPAVVAAVGLKDDTVDGVTVVAPYQSTFVPGERKPPRRPIEMLVEGASASAEAAKNRETSHEQQQTKENIEPDGASSTAAGGLMPAWIIEEMNKRFKIDFGVPSLGQQQQEYQQQQVPVVIPLEQQQQQQAAAIATRYEQEQHDLEERLGRERYINPQSRSPARVFAQQQQQQAVEEVVVSSSSPDNEVEEEGDGPQNLTSTTSGSDDTEDEENEEEDSADLVASIGGGGGESDLQSPPRLNSITARHHSPLGGSRGRTTNNAQGGESLPFGVLSPMSLQSSLYYINEKNNDRKSSIAVDDDDASYYSEDYSDDEEEGNDDEVASNQHLSNLEAALSKMLVEKKAMKGRVDKEAFRAWWRMKKPKVEAVLVEIGRMRGDLER
jgi:hypothetical protein